MVVVPDFYQGRPVLVTGGTGFIGRRLVTMLQTQGAQVRAWVRASGKIPSDWGEVETVVSDLMDAASLARACVGMNTVIHAAGFAHADAADTPDFAARHWAINAEGAFRLMEAAVAAHVERFIFLSSVKAVGDPGLHCVDERWDAPPKTPYGRAKRAAEECLLTVGRNHGLHVVNLRPALVYGPGMKGNPARLIKAIQRGLLPPLPETGNQRSLVHVDDVVQAVLLAAAHPVAAGQSYFVTDNRPYSGRELYLIIRRALGLPASRWSIPAGALYAAAALMDGLLRLAGRKRRIKPTLDKLLGWACYDSTRIRRDLGYQPTWTFQRYCESDLRQWRK